MFKFFNRHEWAKKTANELETSCRIGELSDEALEKIHGGSDYYKMYEEGEYVFVTHFSPNGRALYTDKFLKPMEYVSYKYDTEAGTVHFKYR